MHVHCQGISKKFIPRPDLCYENVDHYIVFVMHSLHEIHKFEFFQRGHNAWQCLRMSNLGFILPFVSKCTFIEAWWQPKLHTLEVGPDTLPSPHPPFLSITTTKAHLPKGRYYILSCIKGTLEHVKMRIDMITFILVESTYGFFCFYFKPFSYLFLYLAKLKVRYKGGNGTK